MQELRTSPRQRRSQESVGAILDAAESLIHEHGQISFTASELAERAGMSVGRIYYWFPDIPAIVTALAERLREQVAARLAVIRTIDPAAPTSEITRALAGALCGHVDHHPATVPVSLIGGSIDFGAGIRREISMLLRGIATARLVDVTDDELDVITTTVSGLQLGVLSQYIAAPSHLKGGVRDELANMLTAWVGARFPFSSDPAWHLADPPVAPARVHRETRPLQPRAN